MDKVARLAPKDRSDLFRAAAEAKGVSVQIIEKDFWVCWVLRQLYTLDELPAPIYFKGGTSLSKAFGVIDRMSEDIDLVIDREALGFTGDRDPSAAGLSNKARRRLISELKQVAADYVRDTLHPRLQNRFQSRLAADPGWTLDVNVENINNTTIEFQYPTAEDASSYLKPMVLLELGARGDTWPAENRSVHPYAADTYPDQFERSETEVRAITAGRTFWEKVTYLHTLAQKDPETVAKQRPARHYYDVYLLAEHELGRRAAKDHDLLHDVVRHKSTFYPRASDRYDLAVPGTLRIVPDEPTIRALRPEFVQMAEEMIFGEAPSFETVIDRLREVEADVNQEATF